MIRASCEHGRTEPHPLWEAHQVVQEDFGDDSPIREWVRCDRTDCDLEVVRPGKVQCVGDYDERGCGQPFEPTVCEPPIIQTLSDFVRYQDVDGVRGRS